MRLRLGKYKENSAELKPREEKLNWLKNRGFSACELAENWE